MPDRRSRTERNAMAEWSRRALPLAAMVVALLGAGAIFISPLTSWTMVLAVGGLVLLLPSGAVLIVWLLRNW
jgi:hypothetical protein